MLGVLALGTERLLVALAELLGRLRLLPELSHQVRADEVAQELLQSPGVLAHQQIVELLVVDGPVDFEAGIGLGEHFGGRAFLSHGALQRRRVDGR